MDEEYISIQAAADLAGMSASALHAAARKGALETRQFGRNARVTTRHWLEAYLATTTPRGIPRRGQQRKGQGAGDGAGE